MELIDILKCHFHLDAFCFPFKIDWLMDDLFLLVHIFNKTDDPIRLMKLNMFCLLSSPILKDNRQFRIQIRRFMQTTLHLICLKLCLLKNLSIRQKIHKCTGLSRLCDHREKAVFQLYDRNPPLIPVMVYPAVPADLHIHIF